MTLKRYKIRIQGIVQGVGFRPFVYREAVRLSISGFVFNDSSGVTIEAEGEAEALENFADSVRTSPPPFAKIHSFEKEEIPPSPLTLSPRGRGSFEIIKSADLGEANTLVSPDIATCADCLADISDPSNRRFRYPFTNCTNCGPRYTIIEGVPYDRPFTSMKPFKMCPECEAEYKDPMDRRYHAQPNACPVCGPRLTLVSSACHSRESGNPVQLSALDPRLRGDDRRGRDDNASAIDSTLTLLAQGKIVAIKGLGGFHLACDAMNEEAVRLLRERKKRDEKPFAVMMPDVETVRKFCELSEEERTLLESPERPIVLLRKKISFVRPEPVEGQIETVITGSVAPNNSYLGVMLPYTPLHHLIFTIEPSNHRTIALVMTSANISDEPICFKNDEALERLKDIADHFLFHDRDIYIRTDDSVARIVNGKPMFLRRARGYSPNPIILRSPSNHRTIEPSNILAVGAELKNTVCLLKGDNAFLSQHIGDMENAASYDSFEKSIEHLRKLFDINPNVIAHDMHPDYFSTRWAEHVIARPEGRSDTEFMSLRAQRSNPDTSELSGLPRRSAPRNDTSIPLQHQHTPRNDTSIPLQHQHTPRNDTLIPVQHHHAHIASCMAENGIDGPVIGIALDGTGYGTDGNIWGGELLIADYKDFERAAHFEYVPMPGGDAAIKNPWQMAIAYLRAGGCFQSAVIASVSEAIQCKSLKTLDRHVALQAPRDDRVNLVLKMLEKGINSPLTSSCGRLFDAVAAILGIRHTVSFEGQAAMELEMKAMEFKVKGQRSKVKDMGRYPYSIENNSCITISYTETIKAILEDIQGGIATPEIALKFHNTLVAALTEVAVMLAHSRGIKDVALSGGCFQNLLLLTGLKNSLEGNNLNVYTHSQVPPNDGGISLGQAAVARARMRACHPRPPLSRRVNSGGDPAPIMERQ